MIKVIIQGIPAAGKTTLALFIASALRKAGFRVEETDSDVLDGSDLPQYQEARLGIVAARSPVEVSTQQVHKDGGTDHLSAQERELIEAELELDVDSPTTQALRKLYYGIFPQL